MFPLTRAAWRKLMFTIADYRLERARLRIAETVADRAWFHAQARKTTPWNHGVLIDAAACAIREKALRDALRALKSPLNPSP